MDEVAGVLVATDLAPRCDRAIGRARLLARALGGTATAATVLDPAHARARGLRARGGAHWYRPPPPRVHAQQWLQREFEDAVVAWDTHVDEGDPGECLSRLLDTRDDPLVVTGSLRSGPFGPAMLGSTVDRLLRRDRASLLVVRERAHAPYRHLLVASDFSAPSRAALRHAHALFPEARITLLHAVDPPMLGVAVDAQVATPRAHPDAQGNAFLREAVPDAGRFELRVEHGDAARLVQQYVDTFAPDLVVVGSHGRSAAYEVVIGSVARRIAATSMADTLVVRG
ncbi:universal stress protein [Luteimonas sp. 3794]|uniref:universal stress protein n=1 Tax=Luteimonas sp. 3794 TaxID=2817730 RepID=UPI0028549AC9|nr:universal stress protein [Luteimonas sp. 3794]MDR6990314.1 nucleotide-binding universal stress UspA family protein [Luteimonas sp. 3794]